MRVVCVKIEAMCSDKNLPGLYKRSTVIPETIVNVDRLSEA